MSWNQGGGGYGSTKAYTDEPGMGEYRDDPGGRGGYQDQGYGNFTKLCDQISSNIFTINSGANNIDKAMKSIGTHKDGVQLRDKIHDISTSTQKVVNETMRLFKRMASQRNIDKRNRMQLDRLKSQFQEAVQRFSRLQKTAAERVRSTTALGDREVKPKKTSDWLDDEDYTSHTGNYVEGSGAPNQQLLEQELVIDNDLNLIREREDRIRQLESDILDVNEIFRDLGAMVHEQGEVIDCIEGNVEKASGNVESGAEQLTQASKYQKKARKKMCIILIIFVIIAAIITIILVTQLHR
ncbi:syntaxin-7-like [Liolophura sinensis]|uniref:syntaxin-7-like n=1 Tax=Liolophura sinensis TaxID=3198878 RepID=UPI00315814C8